MQHLYTKGKLVEKYFHPPRKIPKEPNNLLLFLNSNFTIIDTDDQTRLIKNICKSENIDIKQLAPRFILAIIDRWKNKGYYPSEVIVNNKDVYEKTILPLYKIYQQKLIDLNSCDFGDLILHTVKILENYPDIRQIYTTNFKYILVDEYQDTNFIQSKWLNPVSYTHLTLPTKRIV